jgi:hypothetical protein
VLALIAAPIAGVVWSFLVPLWTGSMANEVAAVAAAPARFVAGTYAGVLMSFLMVPAALALGRYLRPRAPVASDVAAVLLGSGVRLFDHLPRTPAVLGNPTVTAGVGVTHLRYPVRTA